MTNKEILIFYGTIGTVGNNNTIPDDERRAILEEKGEEFPGQEEDRAKKRGEQALDDFYQYYGLRPKGMWQDHYVRLHGSNPFIPIHPSKEEFGITSKGRISKNKRNYQKYLKRKNK